jgi:hypothetical protein
MHKDMTVKYRFLLAFLIIPTAPIFAENAEFSEVVPETILRLKVGQQLPYLIPGINRELLEKKGFKDDDLVSVKKLSELTILTRDQRIEALEFELAQNELKNSGAPISAEENYLFSSAILRGAPIDSLLTRNLRELEKTNYGQSRRLDFLERDEARIKADLIAMGFDTKGLEMSIGFEEGSDAVENLQPSHRGLIPDLDREAAECQGGMDDFNGPLGQKAMDCFVGLDASKYKISHYNPDRKTYLKGLRFVGSIVDQQDRHLCMVSIYKQGVWITAKHCLDGKKLKRSNYLKSADGKTKIEAVRFCKDCDVAFIDLPTPQLTDTDFPKVGIPIVMQDPIFMPGIVLHDSLANVSKQEEFDLKYIWSEIGKGYCKAIKIYKNGCMVHGCSAVPGFSGAPMYIYKDDQLQLVGILSGANGEKNECSYLGSINYSLALKNREDIL